MELISYIDARVQLDISIEGEYFHVVAIWLKTTYTNKIIFTSFSSGKQSIFEIKQVENHTCAT